MRNWTIQGSDHLGRDLVIVDGDGKKMDGVTDVTVYIDPTNGIRASIEIIGVALNVTAVVESVTFRCPSCEDLVMHDCKPQTLGGK